MRTAANLSRGERVERIARLLSKGITLLLIAEKKHESNLDSHEQQAIEEAEKEQPGFFLDKTDDTILEFLRRVQAASPGEIQRNLDLSKTTVFRRLHRLTKIQMVKRSGSTTATRYCLAASRQNGADRDNQIP